MGVVTFNEQKMLYKVGRTGLFYIYCYHTGELFISGPCCQWSAGKPVTCRYNKLCNVLYDTLLHSSAMTVSCCSGQVLHLSSKKRSNTKFPLLCSCS